MRRDERRRTAIYLNQTEKRCFICGETKLLEEFMVDNREQNISGRGPYCRECDRERSRAYYWANRERILAMAAEKRGPRPPRFCTECGVELEGRQLVCCGSAKCRERRFRRLQPESYAAREARKVERRRQAGRRAREEPAPPPAT